MTRIVSVGAYVPVRIVSNDELETRLGLTNGWIERRTGIVERRYAAEHEATSDLAVQAGFQALGAGGTLETPIRLLLLATSTPDHLLPPTAPLVAHKLGLVSCGAIDLANACGGFLAALALGHAYCQSQNCSVLVIAANVLSRRIDPNDPLTAALFSDAAGAVILSPTTDAQNDILSLHLDADGSQYQNLLIPAGGSRTPTSAETVAAGGHFMNMERGGEVYRSAVRGMVRAGESALASAGLTIADIDWWAPHQANARIIADVGGRLGIDLARTISIVRDYGNSSAATIPLALAIATADGRIRRGQRLLLTAAGAGMVEAAAVIRW